MRRVKFHGVIWGGSTHVSQLWVLCSPVREDSWAGAHLAADADRLVVGEGLHLGAALVRVARDGLACRAGT